MAPEQQSETKLNTERVRSVILGGGRGNRLFPLTQSRAKPAVPVAGKYRLIDITLSNCINSELRNIYILTQFNSDSLHRHISTVYRFDNFTRGSVQVLAAQQTTQKTGWYQGTADAVRKTLERIVDEETEHVVILSGDHLYRMDYRELLRSHVERNLDITISALPVAQENCQHFGVLRIDDRANIIEFVEKPTEADVLSSLEVPPEIFQSQDIDPRGRRHIASMGIYVFKKEVLERLLRGSEHSDFGKEVIPGALGKFKIGAWMFDGYWEDIGTIRSFYEANLALTDVSPHFNFFDEMHPMFSRPRFLPGSKINGARISSTVISDGAIIDDAEITNSVVGIRSVIGGNCQIRRSILMGADYYDAPGPRTDGKPPLGIGPGCVIQNAIVDKNVRIGPNVRIVNDKGIMEAEHSYYYIREGITIIPRRAVVPADTVI